MEHQPKTAVPRSLENVIAQLKALSVEDERCLRKNAAYRVFPIKALVCADADDLLQEAITQTITAHHNLEFPEEEITGRARVWQSDIDVLRHLMLAMQRIATDWYRQAKNKVEFHPDNLGRDGSDLGNILDAERIKWQLHEPLLRTILELWQQDYKPQEIRELLLLDAKAYNAAWNRIKRALKASETRNDGAKQTKRKSQSEPAKTSVRRSSGQSHEHAI